MTLSTTLAIYLGVLIECLWLWDAASEKFKRPDKERLAMRGAPTAARAMGIALAAGVILIGLAEWAGENPVTDYLNGVLQYLLMGATMFFILIAGAVGGRLLPRVNEYSVVGVLTTATLNAVAGGPPFDPRLAAALVGLSLVLAAALALQRTSPGPTGKVLLYLLYLAALIYLMLQSGVVEASGQSHFTLPEAFAFGSAFTFLSLHALFGVRFFVIASSLILPANRVYAQPVMGKLFRDDQIAPLSFFLALAGVVGAVLLNRRLALFPADTFAGVMVILCTQLLFRSRKAAGEGERTARGEGEPAG